MSRRADAARSRTGRAPGRRLCRAGLRATLFAWAILFPLCGLAQIPPTIIHYNVNTSADQIDDNVLDGLCHTSANTCSLRAAVMQANHLTTANLIAQIHVPAGTYVLTRTSSGSSEENYDLDLTTALNANQQIAIIGAGAGRTIIDGNHTDRVIYVESNRFAVLSDLTLRNGENNDGGGIFNNGSLTISDCVIEDNLAIIGLNIPGSKGGGIYNSDDAVLALFDTTLRTNRGDKGGGLYQTGSAKIRSSTIQANAAVDGGGVYNTGELIVVDSTLSSNAADTDGGAIYSDNDAFLYNVSAVGNIADYDHDINGGLGGGLYAEPGARFVVVNSLIASNGVNGGFTDNDCNGSFEIYGYNLFGEAVQCSFTGNGGAALGFVSAASIGPLQDNGGPTLTHALLPGSEAIDATNAQGCIDEAGAPLALDQRSAPRVAGLRCDSGAYEYGAVIDMIFKSGFDY